MQLRFQPYVLALCACVCMSAQAQIAPALAPGQQLNAQQLQAMGPLQSVDIGGQKYRVLPAQKAGGDGRASYLVDASGKVGRTFHEVLIVGLPTAQVRQQLGASLSQAQAVKYYEHTQTTLLRYATLEQAAAAQAQISAALPGATVHLPVRFSQPQLH